MKAQIFRLISSFSGLFLLISCTDACRSMEDGVVNGSLKRSYKDEEKDLTINGSLEASEIAVNNLTVNGSAKLGPHKSFIRAKLKINGNLEANNIDVKQGATINGNLEIDDAHFWDDLRVNGQAEIGSSIIEGNVYVSKTITLKSGVTIKGHLEFIEEPGVAHIRGKDIHILKGILNGKAEERGSDSGAPAVHF